MDDFECYGCPYYFKICHNGCGCPYSYYFREDNIPNDLEKKCKKEEKK